MAKLGRKGHFIVVEGTDGSGKATQVKFLRRRLQMMDLPHHIITFPQYTANPYGKLIASYLRGDFGEKESNNTFLLSLAYAGDRFLAKPDILARLRTGEIVIADRYVPSNKAYMAAKLPKDAQQEFLDWLDDLEYNVNGIPREELVIFLYVDPEMSQELFSGRTAKIENAKSKKDIHEADLAFQKESSRIYLQLAKEEPNWVVINCVEKGELRSREDIHNEIVSVLEKRGIIPHR